MERTGKRVISRQGELEDLVEDDAERVDVGGEAVNLATANFGCHPEGSS